MVAYYNEIDLYAAQWLRNLIVAGHIALGDVDTRPIQEVQPDDLRKYTQCHFFAGIAGWSHALRLADWPDDRPVWTGSCPCQPFSNAGKQEGHADERHLWPHWFRLIRECRPATIFGEQVAGAVAFGWLDEVFNDLEAENYACAASILPACSVGAPHKRDRLWFMANTSRGRFSKSAKRKIQQPGGTKIISTSTTLANPHSNNGHWWSGPLQVGWNCIEGKITNGSDGKRTKWLTKPGVGLLANGVPARVGRLRAYGNAIVPQVAAEFIKATM